MGLGEREISQVWANFEGTIRNGADLIDLLASEFSEFRSLVDLWDKTPLKHLELTTVGTAIGYANLARVTGFDADLGIWIK